MKTIKLTVLPKVPMGKFLMNREKDRTGNLSVATRRVTTENAPVRGFREAQKEPTRLLAGPSKLAGLSKIIAAVQMLAALGLVLAALPLGKMAEWRIGKTAEALTANRALLQQHQEVYRLTTANLARMQDAMQHLGTQLLQAAERLQESGHDLNVLGSHWYMAIGEAALDQSAESLDHAGIGSGAVAQALLQQAAVMREYATAVQPSTEAALAATLAQMDQYGDSLIRYARPVRWLVIGVCLLGALLLGGNGLAIWALSREPRR